MTTKYFEDCYELINEILCLHEDDNFVVITDYNVISEIAQYVIQEYAGELWCVDICAPEVCGYNDVYYFEMDEDKIYIGPALVDGTYKHWTSNNIYVFEDTNSKFVLSNTEYNNTITIFSFDSQVSKFCDSDCDGCDLDYKDNEVYTELSKDSKGNIVGFTQSGRNGDSFWSRSFYSNNPNAILEEFQLMQNM